MSSHCHCGIWHTFVKTSLHSDATFFSRRWCFVFLVPGLIYGEMSVVWRTGYGPNNQYCEETTDEIWFMRDQFCVFELESNRYQMLIIEGKRKDWRVGACQFRWFVVYFRTRRFCLPYLDMTLGFIGTEFIKDTLFSFLSPSPPSSPSSFAICRLYIYHTSRNLYYITWWELLQTKYLRSQLIAYCATRIVALVAVEANA